MESAVDALKMAFAVFVFVIALTSSMMVFGQAKETSEHVFYMTDKTNFYDYETGNNRQDGRIVSGETIIPTLYRYYKENFNVIIIPKNKNKLTNPEKGAIIYNLEEEVKDYNKNYKNAPWLGNANVDSKKRIDIDLSGIPGKINGVLYPAQYDSNIEGMRWFNKLF